MVMIIKILTKMIMMIKILTKMIMMILKRMMIFDDHDDYFVYLVEEVSAEEEELLGKDFCKTGEDPEAARTVQHDQHLAKTLDKLILYIR